MVELRALLLTANALFKVLCFTR